MNIQSAERYTVKEGKKGVKENIEQMGRDKHGKGMQAGGQNTPRVTGGFHSYSSRTGSSVA